jgi:hypothetical protein
MGVLPLFFLPLFFLVFASAPLTMFSLLYSCFVAALLVFLLPNKMDVQQGAAASVEGFSSSSSSVCFFFVMFSFSSLIYAGGGAVVDNGSRRFS